MGRKAESRKNSLLISFHVEMQQTSFKVLMKRKKIFMASLSYFVSKIFHNFHLKEIFTVIFSLTQKFVYKNA